MLDVSRSEIICGADMSECPCHLLFGGRFYLKVAPQYTLTIHRVALGIFQTDLSFISIWTRHAMRACKGYNTPVLRQTNTPYLSD